MKLRTIKHLCGLSITVLFIGCCLFGGCFHSVEEEDTVDAADGEGSDTIPVHIEFISAEPATIALKNTGGPGRSETSALYFKITGENGKPCPNTKVLFELSTDVGNLYLSHTTDTSDGSGLVGTTVNSGTVPTHIRVKATIKNSDPRISVVSDELLISTGLPDQNSVTMHPKPHNPETLYYDNVEVPVTFQAADHFNNFVPDGTVVYFTTEGGAIDDSCVLVNGVCEVTWRSGPPYPDDGFITILAFAIGEESFTDYNGNGFFDENDVFDLTTDLAEPFRDDDDNGYYSVDEPWWDFNNDGLYNDTPNGIYNGTLCSEGAEDKGVCTRDLVYVQFEENIVNSGSFAVITFSTQVVYIDDTSAESVTIYISDEKGNPMPSDSKVTITTTNGQIMGDASFTIPDSLFGPTTVTLSIIDTNNTQMIDNGDNVINTAGDVAFGLLTVKVTTPFNNISAASIEVRDK